MGQTTRGEKQHALIQRKCPLADGFTEQAGTLETGQGHGDRIDEHRNHRAALQTAEQQFQRLGERMINLHTIGDGGIDAGIQHALRAGFSQHLGHFECAGSGAEIADGVSRHTDAEGRHHVVEKAVVVIGAEQHDQLRVEAGDALTGFGDHRIDLGQHLWSRIDETHQWRVRHAMQICAHLKPPCWQQSSRQVVAVP
ncbi:hypothetical protein D9M71_184470 [compost metagenome]